MTCSFKATRPVSPNWKALDGNREQRVLVGKTTIRQLCLWEVAERFLILTSITKLV